MKQMLWILLTSLGVLSYTAAYGKVRGIEKQDVRNQNLAVAAEVVHIKDPEIAQAICALLEETVARQGMEVITPQLASCYELLMAGNTTVPTSLLYTVLPDLVRFFHDYMEEIKRAPRPDNPPFIVGPGCCSLESILAAILALQQELEECCTQLEIDFTITFSLLADLKATLTACCTDIKGTLTEIFATLTTCCNTIETTLTVEIFNTLTTCCNTIETTLTVEIFNTLTTCCNTIETTLTTCCNTIETTLTVEIFNTLTTCCNNIETTLTTCCNTIESTLTTCCNNIETTLTVEILNTLTKCCADIKGTLTEIETTLTTCCNNTVDIFNTLTTCCNNIETTLTVEILNTLTTCCADIKGSLTEIETTLTTCCDDIFNTLTTCCSTIIDTVTSFSCHVTVNLSVTTNGGCPVILITQAIVDAAGGALVLSIPGNYIFQEDIISNGPGGVPIFHIEADNITVDMCGRALIGKNESGVANIGFLIDGGLDNISIRNGFITSFSTAGIDAEAGFAEFTIERLYLEDCGNFGIHLSGSGPTDHVTTGFIQDCTVIASGTNAFNGLTQAGIALNFCDNVIVKRCICSKNGSSSVSDVGGILLANSSDLQVVDCQASDNTGNNHSFGCRTTSCIKILFDHCGASDNIGTTTVRGFEIQDGSKITLEQCIANANSAQFAAGFAFQGTTIESIIAHSIAQENLGEPSTTNFFGVGVFIDGAEGALFNALENNTYIDNSHAGVYDNSFAIAQAGSVFTISLVNGGSRTLVTENIAIRNGSVFSPFVTSSSILPASLGVPAGGGVLRNYAVVYNLFTTVTAISVNWTMAISPITTLQSSQLSNLDIQVS